MTGPALHHLALLVEDLPAAEAFYHGVLGLPVERRWTEDDGGLRSVWLTLGTGRLMLERSEAGATRRDDAGGGWHLLALAMPPESREGWRTRLAEAGHPVDAETEHTLYVRDPEGNRVALSSWPAP